MVYQLRSTQMHTGHREMVRWGGKEQLNGTSFNSIKILCNQMTVCLKRHGTKLTLICYEVNCFFNTHFIAPLVSQRFSNFLQGEENCLSLSQWRERVINCFSINLCFSSSLEDGHNIDQDGLMIKKSRMGNCTVTHSVPWYGASICEDIVKSVLPSLQSCLSVSNLSRGSYWHSQDCSWRG